MWRHSRFVCMTAIIAAVLYVALGADGALITSITPDRGAAGVVVTVRGENFGAIQGGRMLAINLCSSNELRVIRWSDTAIQARVPAGLLAGNYRVLLYLDGSRRTSSNSLEFHVTAPRRQFRTLHEGLVGYEAYYQSRPFESCWWARVGGEVTRDPSAFFDLRHTPDVDRLVAAIGLPAERTNDSREIWRRVTTVWGWLRENQLNGRDRNYAAAQRFLADLHRWPALAEVATMYVRFGGIVWGTCMSRAQMFATLLAAVGVPHERFGIAEARWKPEYSQHMYVALFLNQRWFYLDPTYIEDELRSDVPSSVGRGAADYVHPRVWTGLPGTRWTTVPRIGTFSLSE